MEGRRPEWTQAARPSSLAGTGACPTGFTRTKGTNDDELPLLIVETPRRSSLLKPCDCESVRRGSPRRFHFHSAGECTAESGPTRRRTAARYHGSWRGRQKPLHATCWGEARVIWARTEPAEATASEIGKSPIPRAPKVEARGSSGGAARASSQRGASSMGASRSRGGGGGRRR
jgi:hypothetical protein